MASRRPRLSSDETRTRLLDAGAAALNRAGMSVGLDAVNLEQAVRDADVPRSSAYAVWSTDEGLSPQEDFQLAVLKNVVESRKRTLEDLAGHPARVLATLDPSLPRRDQLWELMRQISKLNVEATAESMEWKLAIALRAILHSSSPENRDGGLAEWLTESAAALSALTVETVYKPMAELFEVEPRAEYGESAYVLTEAAVSALSEGLSVRYWHDTARELDGLAHPRGAKGEWTIFGLMVEQIIELFFVPKQGSWRDY